MKCEFCLFLQQEQLRQRNRLIFWEINVSYVQRPRTQHTKGKAEGNLWFQHGSDRSVFAVLLSVFYMQSMILIHFLAGSLLQKGYLNNYLFFLIRYGAKKSWQWALAEVCGTRWKLLWLIPLRSRQPLNASHQFRSHVQASSAPTCTDGRSCPDETLYTHLRIHLLAFTILFCATRAGQQSWFFSGYAKFFFFSFAFLYKAQTGRKQGQETPLGVMGKCCVFNSL